MRSYTELMQFLTFEERFNYLKLNGQVSSRTFGGYRAMNQALYQRNPVWRRIRDQVITRDLGCDLGDPNRPIFGKIVIHHMNPITPKQLWDADPDIYNPEYLISVSFQTHNAIHYGDEKLISKDPIARRPNDVCPWKNNLIF